MVTLASWTLAITGFALLPVIFRSLSKCDVVQEIDGQMAVRRPDAGVQPQLAPIDIVAPAGSVALDVVEVRRTTIPDMTGTGAPVVRDHSFPGAGPRCRLICSHFDGWINLPA